MKKLIKQYLKFHLAILLTFLLTSCGTAPLPPVDGGGSSPVPVLPSGNQNLLLGNPSGATHEPDNANNYLIERPQYVLSYNRKQAVPNWASWQLNSNWLGDLPRPPFTPDSSLPPGWYRVIPNHYTGSGFDRGHVVPAADRNAKAEDSAAVFLMSNIFPQAPDNNQGPWEKLEAYCRELVRGGKELYIVAGVAGHGGVGNSGEQHAIADGRITVPAQTWKTIVVLNKPGLGLNGISTKTRVIAVIMPNVQGIKGHSWRQYRTSVRAIEDLTNYNLLANVPTEIQDIIETTVDTQ